MSSSSQDFGATVTSYLPTGAHDTVVPMGKYYPSNYESRSRHVMRHSSSSTSVGSSTSYPQQQPQHPRSETELKRRLQQYQRDMIAQTRLVASTDSAFSPSSAGSATPSATPSSAQTPRSPFGYTNPMLFTAALMKTPISPRLHPLGSPGPVTPMNLEDGSTSGDYLTKGGSQPSTVPASRDLAGSDRRAKERGRR